MVELIEVDLNRPHPESAKIASIIEKDKDLLKEYYAANFDDGVYEEDEVEGEEEEDIREDDDAQNDTENELCEYTMNKNTLESAQYKTPSKMIKYKNQYFKFINGESQKRNDEDASDSNYDQDVEENEEVETVEDNDYMYIKSRGYYSSTDKYRFRIKSKKDKSNTCANTNTKNNNNNTNRNLDKNNINNTSTKKTINIQLSQYNVFEDNNLHNYIENLDEDNLKIPILKRFEEKLKNQRIEFKKEKSDDADYSDNQCPEEEISHEVFKSKVNNRYQKNLKSKINASRKENKLLDQVKYSYQVEENSKNRIKVKTQYILNLEEELKEELAKPMTTKANGKQCNHKININKSNYKEGNSNMCHKKEALVNSRPEKAQEHMFKEDETETLNSKQEIDPNKNNYVITSIPSKPQSCINPSQPQRHNNCEAISRKRDNLKFLPNDTANPNMEIDELVRIIDQTGTSNTKKSKNALKKQKKEKEKEKEKEKPQPAVVTNLNKTTAKSSNKKVTRSNNDNQQNNINQVVRKNNFAQIHNEEIEIDDDDPNLIEKFKLSLQMSSIHKNLVWKEQSYFDKY